MAAVDELVGGARVTPGSAAAGAGAAAAEEEEEGVGSAVRAGSDNKESPISASGESGIPVERGVNKSKEEQPKEQKESPM